VPHDSNRAIGSGPIGSGAGSVQSPRNGSAPLGGLVGQAVGAAGWLNRAGWGIARRLPGGALVEQAVRPVERAVAAEVKRQLRSLGLLDSDPTGARRVEGQAGDVQVTTVVRPVDRGLDPLRTAMAELLNRSVEQTREQSEHQLYAGILRQLVPDEARMLAAVSDGSRYPLIHVASRNRMGGIRRLVLENASTLGRAAGAQLSASTSTFVTHLLQLGLLDVDPEDRDLAVQYEILQTDDLVRAAEAEAKADGGGGVKVIRQTVRMSELGRRFWDACHPGPGSLEG
jgi:Abortive infection alpha